MTPTDSTERLLEELLKKEEFLRLATEAAEIGVWEVDLRTGKVIWNEQCRKVFSIPPDIPVTYELFLSMIHPDDRPMIERTTAELRNGMTEFSHAYRICTENGIRWIADSGKLLSSETGPIRLVGVVRDMTPEKEAEGALISNTQSLEEKVRQRTAELAETVSILKKEILSREQLEEERRQNEKLFQDIFLKNSCVKLLIQPDTGEIIQANPAAAEYYGYPLLQLGKMNITEINVMPAELVRQEMEKTQTEQRKYFNFRHRLASGEVRDVEVYSTPVDFQGAKLLYSIIHDITERKRAEEALRVSEKRYRTIFEETRDMIYIMTPDGHIAEINGAGQEILGYSHEELLRIDVDNLYWNPQDRSTYRKELFRNGSLKEIQMDLKNAQGRKITCVGSATLLRDEQENIVGYMGTYHDVTEKIRLREQLLQSQKMESLGLLAGGVAHDFNNLLTAIRGYTALVRDAQPEGSDNALFLDQVLGAADRASELTRSLLAFGRKQVMNPRQILFNDLIEGLSRMLSRIIGDDIVVETVLSDRDPVVQGDAGQLEQALINLVTNARDAMPGGGRLTISTGEKLLSPGEAKHLGLRQGGRFVTAAVADTGTGIDQKIRESIFEPFFTTKPVGKGTGLGLSIIHGIVSQHNGAIEVETSSGGTIFTIYLPAAGTNPKETDTENHGTDELQERKILVVDDDAIVASLLRLVLEKSGYTVVTASDGAQGLETFFAEENIALVISDVVMPRMNGRDFHDELNRRRPGTRFMFISGYPADFLPMQGGTEQPVEFIQKPVVAQELLRKVKEALAAGP